MLLQILHKTKNDCVIGTPIVLVEVLQTSIVHHHSQYIRFSISSVDVYIL